MNTAHLFSGAGGGMLADLIMGHEPIYAIDIDGDCIENIERNKLEWFPNVKAIKADAGKYDAHHWKGRVDIIHAGVPCPRWSSARRGQGSTYDGWPDTLRITEQASPRFLFLECVANFKKEHKGVKNDLKAIGYGITDYIITSAASVGAPHTRKRYWAIAYANNESEPVRSINAEMAFLSPSDSGVWWETQPRVPGVDDGVANRVYRFKATGNGQVPIQSAIAWIILGGKLGFK